MRENSHPQGLWDFPNIHAYVDRWIVPFMLSDFRTIFEGARIAAASFAGWGLWTRQLSDGHDASERV
jgi:hypothetical protein